MAEPKGDSQLLGPRAPAPSRGARSQARSVTHLAMEPYARSAHWTHGALPLRGHVRRVRALGRASHAGRVALTVHTRSGGELAIRRDRVHVWSLVPAGTAFRLGQNQRTRHAPFLFHRDGHAQFREARVGTPRGLDHLAGGAAASIRVE